MNHFIRHPFFYAALLLIFISAITVVSLLRRSLRDVHRLQLKLDRERDELTVALATIASSDGETGVATATELADAKKKLSELESSVADKSHHTSFAAEAPEPANSTDAFFDLAVFSERMRSRAHAAGVTLKADERFGFSEFVSNGPAKEAISVIFRQRAMMERLLESIFRAGPRELVSVQRSPLRATQRNSGIETRTKRSTLGSTRTEPVAADRNGDYFQLEERLSLAVPGLVETTAFRVSFCGQTDTLREVLNELAATDRVCSVRSVVVTPRARPDATSVGHAPVSGRRLLVAPADLLFTVSVEFFELVAPLQPGG